MQGNLAMCLVIHSAGYSTENSNVIDKFPFATDGNATDVGDLTLGRNAPAGQSSTEFGYASGGNGDSLGIKT